MKQRLWKGALGLAVGSALVVWLMILSKGESRGPFETWVKEVKGAEAREVLRLYRSGLYKRVVGCDTCDRLQQLGKWKRSPGRLELSPSGGGRPLKFMHMNFLGCEALVTEPSVERNTFPGEASIYFLDPDPCERPM